ncbi:response regulator [Neobacillus sp. PS3-34]|uniref:response regulator n=1 Tax=Neobacillus sp. PS3-34 TaxID=3070678 RepID=UPI0027E009E9|nr:response regulator [Neobacillus sp. PS3-34]WML50239.1 response regulator [Neobacillus sp. PS3-34]
MKILFIEDDDIKANTILDYLNELPIEFEFTRRHSWQSGLIEIIGKKDYFEMIILDMSMPRYDPDIGDVNEEFETFAGWDILKEMNRRKLMIPTSIVTSFDHFGEGMMDRFSLDDTLNKEFKNFYNGMIFFNSSQMSWKDELYDKIRLVRGN